MTKFKKLFTGILCLSVSVFTMVSCLDEPVPEPLQAIVDVSVHDIKTDAGVKYGIAIYAVSNYEIKSAKVTAPGTGGKVYQLTATTDKRQFIFTPTTDDYTAEMPLKGDYSFEITSLGDEKITGKDVVGEVKLAAITIKTAAMTNHLLKTTWDKIQEADSYVVRFYSANKVEMLFASTFLAADKVEYEFGETTQGWASGKSPVVNTNYVIELLGIKFESGATTDKGSNIQFITLDSKTIKWE